MSERSSSTRQKRKTEPDSPPPTDKKPDVMDDFMFKAADYIYRRKKLFISLVAAAAVLLISGYGAFEFINYREDLRNRELHKIERQIYDSSLSEEERFEKTMPMLNEFVDKYPQTKQRSLALFYRANLNFKRKDYQKAEDDLKTLLFSSDRNSAMSAMAGIYLANILWDQDKAGESIQTLESLKSEGMAEIILMELAEKYLSVNRNQEARQTLEILLKDFPKTQHRKKATELLKII